MGEEVKGNEEISENQSDNKSEKEMTKEEKEQAEANKKVYKKILENYKQLNQMMVDELEMASLHPGLTGNYREEMWLKFFRNIIPRKYSLAQGVMIIDSNKKVSKEVDIAVYDEQYTPYVFQYNTLKFIPIEAVAVVIECKSTDLPKKSLSVWSDSINNLCTKASGIARMVQGYSVGFTNPSQKKSSPIKILASIKKSETEETHETIKNKFKDHFDFIIYQNKTSGQNRFEVVVPNLCKTLRYWADKLNGTQYSEVDEQKGLALFGSNQTLQSDKICENHQELKLVEVTEIYKEGENEKKKAILHLTNTLEHLEIPKNPLLSLNFQLNQLLMLINNPMLFPHFAYAKAFRDIASEMKEKEKAEKDHKTNEQKAKK